MKSILEVISANQLRNRTIFLLNMFEFYLSDNEFYREGVLCVQSIVKKILGPFATRLKEVRVTLPKRFSCGGGNK